MDGLIEFVLSINKIALLAFFGVLGFLIFEVKKMNDEKKKKEKPVIPQFNDAIIKGPVEQMTSTPLPQKLLVKKAGNENSTIFMIGIGVVTLVGVIFILIITYKTNLKK